MNNRQLTHETVINKILNKDVDVFIQWIYDGSNTRNAFEILARIKLDEEHIPATKFIDLLHQQNTIVYLDIVMLSKVIENFDKIKKLSDVIFVNLYPTSVQNGRVITSLNTLAKLCDEKNVMLNLELTEHTILVSLDSLRPLFSHKSFSVVVDDFGSGCANYDLVGNLIDNNMIKYIKIDGKFITKMTKSKSYFAMVECMSSFCKKSELKVIYESIEDVFLLNLVKNIGRNCQLNPSETLYQGYYFHTPNALDDEL